MPAATAILAGRALDEDRLSASDFERIADLIGREVGIRLPPGKRLMVEGRLRRRLRALELQNFDIYCRYLFSGNGLQAELPNLINVVTTNKTDFFREPEHFNLMRSMLVPGLLAARSGTHQPLLKVWSAAASTGAEAYTTAMVLADLARQNKDFRFAILGTDVSTEVLDTARRAIYPADQIMPVPAEYQSRYLLWPRRRGLRNEVRIVPELRRHVRFEHLNLMDTSYPYDRDVDIILLRNVLIYFSKSDQAAVISRLVGHLRPGGYLLLGHSESMIGTAVPVRQVAPAVFQRV